MASIIIVVIACSKSLYKAGQKRRNKKRELAAAFAQGDKPGVRHRRSAQPARRPRRVLNNNNGGSHYTATTYSSSNGLVPSRLPEPLEPAESRDDLESLARASTIASESGGGRRRMSDESTLAEVAREGAWTART
ncbi:hypothetical protein HC256_006960 [Beauveria bassiana]|uniref:Uncharacterized protein n=1 Tax=Beauveria bassiana (strain ARSEF 2860) TaxID=655819 RepID=J5K1C9_BEAB2|nr:uncharacterized protein BBA_02922 [Beauveria bassiana ARSEF 2860]EJP68026.1 hypothetical protein BBA_02922 [Beauveria bassiana ARSEF 2860]KAH8713837.1 hypothetical protein HC256_006960 [Beauveria bassiana]